MLWEGYRREICVIQNVPGLLSIIPRVPLPLPCLMMILLRVSCPVSCLQNCILVTPEVHLLLLALVQVGLSGGESSLLHIQGSPESPGDHPTAASSPSLRAPQDIQWGIPGVPLDPKAPCAHLVPHPTSSAPW